MSQSSTNPASDSIRKRLTAAGQFDRERPVTRKEFDKLRSRLVKLELVESLIANANDYGDDDVEELGSEDSEDDDEEDGDDDSEEGDDAEEDDDPSDLLPPMSPKKPKSLKRQRIDAK